MSEGPDRLRRKTQQRSLRTKQKLLDAALESFSENGFKGTSTRDIAARAGVHHPLITYHFTNKDRLWRSAVKYVFQDFISELQNAQQDYEASDVKERFAKMIRIYVRYAAKHPELHKIILQESSNQSERLEWLVENFLRPVADGAIGYIVELQNEGVVPNGDPRLIYNMIRVSSGTLIALAREIRNTSDIDMHDTQTLDELSNLIVQVFLPGQVALA